MSSGLAIALLASGCDRRADLPVAPEPTQQDAVDEVVVTAPPLVDPAKLQEDAIDALDSGDLETAFKLIRAAKAAAPDDPQVIFLTARVLAERNRFAEAIKMLDDLAETVPEARLPALGQTAEWSVFQGEWEEAERRYRSLLSEVGNASMVHRLLAQLLYRQGRRLEAATSLHELCRAGNIEEVELRSLLNSVHPFAGELASGEFAPIGPLGRARYQIGEGDWDAALEELAGATVQSPDEYALRGRIYAQQRDFDSLQQWATDAKVSTNKSADHWFALGAHQAHQEDHAGAVDSFCEVVLHDPTDGEAYLLMSRSLAQLGADDEAKQAATRAKLIQQTQQIGSQMAASEQRDLQIIAELSNLLDQLERPLEALAWRAVLAVYSQSSGAITEQQAMQAFSEINQTRRQRLQAGDTQASEQFILCGVDRDALNRGDGARE